MAEQTNNHMIVDMRVEVPVHMTTKDLERILLDALNPTLVKPQKIQIIPLGKRLI